MKKAYIFHGWQGNSQENWLPWLKEQLEKEGFKVIVPDFPDSDNPDLESWLNFLKTEKCDFDKNTV